MITDSFRRHHGNIFTQQNVAAFNMYLSFNRNEILNISETFRTFFGYGCSGYYISAMRDNNIVVLKEGHLAFKEELITLKELQKAWIEGSECMMAYNRLHIKMLKTNSII